MIGFWIVVALLVAFVLLFFAGASADPTAPPATRRDLDRADRHRRADVTPALERAAFPSRPHALVVVVVKERSPNDDPRRWN